MADTLTIPGRTETDDNWRQLAACRGMDTSMFFAHPSTDALTYRRALAVCGRCQVRGDCAADARGADIDFGIWGGKDRTTRRGIDRGTMMLTARAVIEATAAVTGHPVAEIMGKRRS